MNDDIGHQMIFVPDDQIEPDTTVAATIVPADDLLAKQLLMSNRSNFVWVTLCNGDIMLACFPQGERWTQLAVDDAARSTQEWPE